MCNMLTEEAPGWRLTFECHKYRKTPFLFLSSQTAGQSHEGKEQECCKTESTPRAEIYN